jgi:hypothetical protein
MLVKPKATFTTVTTEGALLPPDMLARIRDGDASLAGLKPSDYHLPERTRLNEAINRSWSALQGAWAAFRSARERLPEDDPGTTVTRERWLLNLFSELGYGRLLPGRAIELNGKSYPISHHYGHAPIHLVGCNVPLDRRTAGVAGAARSSPHSLVQAFLNANEDNLWGFVSNGLKLRILRDNVSLVRQAYVEFDLEAMMDGEVYSDFVLLWLLAHQSRVESEKPEECWLERWTKAAADEAVPVLDKLREGVERAITALGQGFLEHPANTPLRDKLRDGTLPTQDLYRQLLRLVYRLLFLFVAEDRDLLLTPDTSDETRRRFAFYSTARLRALAQRHAGTRHADLFEGLKLVMDLLGKDGQPALGLPALGSFLFSRKAIPDLHDCRLGNAHLLRAVRALAYTEVGGVRRPVDYQNLGSEELGSVYESLLELHPEVDIAAGAFALKTASGNERKTTGSYYTPSSLISLLLDSALDPVLDEAVKGKSAEEAERALLRLKIVDPACGSGHFLIAAAQRTAKRLAAVRTGDDESAPEALRHALRDVIGHCIYGVDIGEMAAELCKVALWMEALEPGKPLSFLEHRIRVGNSLLGTTRALIKKGIPDDAFKPIEGDDKEVVSVLKKRNKQERGGAQPIFETFAEATASALPESFAQLDELPDDSPEDVRCKEQRFAELLASEDYTLEELMADAWCAAFVWPKVPGTVRPITQADLFNLRQTEGMPEEQRREVKRLSSHYKFFHWHLAFPEVFPEGGEGGFDVVLGNPPWERIKIQEKEWFATRHPDIANARNASERGKLIRALKDDDPALYEAFEQAKRQAEGESHYARSSGRYPLTGRGDVNTYPLFAELGRSLQGPRGRMGMILPSGIATDDTTKFFFQALVESKTLASLFDFENRQKIFPGIDSRIKFCLLTLSGEKRPVSKAEFAFFALDPTDVRDPEKRFTLSPEDIALLNPNTKTCPVFRSRRDAEITKSIYRRVPVLVNEATGDDPWGIKFMRMFDMSNDSGLFKTREALEPLGFTLRGNHFVRGDEVYLPLYEAKLMHQFDHRFATYTPSGDTRDMTAEEHQNPNALPLPRYWVKKNEVMRQLEPYQRWQLSYRRFGPSTNERSIIAKFSPVLGFGDSEFITHPAGIVTEQACTLLQNFNAYAFDYVARAKIGGTNINFFILRQLPILPPTTYTPSDLAFITPRVLELTYTAWDLEPFARDLGYGGPPFIWYEERRFWLRAELDALYFHLYGIERGDVDYIMETFPIVKRKDEARYGCYRTKEAILEIYDEMARCRAEGRAYRTRLEPPPADSRVAHPEREVELS